jgi:hypothetical protein
MSLRAFLMAYVASDDIVSIRTSEYREAFDRIGLACDFLHMMDDPHGYLEAKVLEVFVGQDEILTIRIDKEYMV